MAWGAAIAAGTVMVVAIVGRPAITSWAAIAVAGTAADIASNQYADGKHWD